MYKRVKTIVAMAAGAALAYLLDPDRGRSRRVELGQRSASMGRKAAEGARKRARYRTRKIRGVLHEAMSPESQPATDGELLQKVRSEAVGMVPGSTGHVDVRVQNGVVELVGHSQDPDVEEDLMRRIARVTGVRAVHNELVRS